MTQDADRSLRIYLAYATLALPLAFVGLPLYIYLPAHYAALPGIGVALTGMVLLFARLLDLITDPLVGIMIDRYRASINYRVFIASSAPVFLLGVWLLFVPPQTAGPGYLLLAVSLTYLGWTLLSVPYYAWGAELVTSSAGQVKLASWREAAVIMGMLLALLAPVMSTGQGNGLATSLQWIFWLMVVALPMLLLVPQPASASHRTRAVRLADAWRDTGAPARRLLLLHFTNTLANGIPATLFLLYAQQSLGLSMQAAGILLLIYFLSAIVALPGWHLLARHQGRVAAWRNAIALAAVGFVPAVFLGEDDGYWFAVVCVLTGVCAGADIALPAAIQAHLAHKETTSLQRPRSASLFGLWGMANKLALAFAVGISLPLLGLLTDVFAMDAATVLPWLYAGIAVVIKLLVAGILSRHVQTLEGNDEDDTDALGVAAVRSGHGL